jgi:mannose-6-phosphate isomerase-like protein (cupin superfamily)
MRFQIFICLISFATTSFALDTPKAEFKDAPVEPSFLADDGSIIRTMPHVGGVQSVQCLLPKEGVIQACRHKTVSQIWYVIAGEGDMWLKDTTGTESVTPLKKGVALTVPLGYSFQFRNTGKSDLEIFIVNATPWSGAGELIPVTNHWAPHVPPAH